MLGAPPTRLANHGGGRVRRHALGMGLGTKGYSRRGCTHVMHGRSRTAIRDPQTPSKCRDGVRLVSTDQADTASTKRGEPRGVVRRVARRANCFLYSTPACEADFLAHSSVTASSSLTSSWRLPRQREQWAYNLHDVPKWPRGCLTVTPGTHCVMRSSPLRGR